MSRLNRKLSSLFLGFHQVYENKFFGAYSKLFPFLLSLYFLYSGYTCYKKDLLNLRSTSKKKISQTLKCLPGLSYFQPLLSLLLSSLNHLLINNKPSIYNNLKIWYSLKKLSRLKKEYSDLKKLLLIHFLGLCFCKKRTDSKDQNSSKNNSKLLFCTERCISRNLSPQLTFLLSSLNNPPN